MTKNFIKIKGCAKIFYFLLFLGLFSCKKSVKTETEVYNNTFETGDLSNITSGQIELYNGTKVLGRYNKGGFNLTLTTLPKHDLVEVSFDLYIHDSWDGDAVGVDGPDIWEMILDKSTYISASFSNTYCNPGTFCAPQSYPANYPNNNNNPRTGAYNTNLPGVCGQINNPIGTTQYKITKTINHTSGTLTLQCLDHLVQTNTTDQKCDESWSVDNIKIKAIAL